MDEDVPWYATVAGVLEHMIRFEEAFSGYDNTGYYLRVITHLNYLEQGEKQWQR